MIKHSSYTALFRSAASAHKLIQHSEQSPAFARLILSADPFLSAHEQIDDFLSNNERRLKTPMMLITNYEAGYKNQGGEDIEKHLAGRMIILVQVKEDDFQAQEEALDLTEEIGEQCLSYIENQSETNDNVPYFFFDWDRVESERITKLTNRNLYGTAFNFPIQAAAPNTVYNPENFTE